MRVTSLCRFSPLFSLIALTILAFSASPCPAGEAVQLQKLRDARWPAEKAWKWYAGVGPICGCNYLPRTAVNTTEMWQKETFDPKTIDEELGWAEKAGMNSVRVFVQCVVYEADPQGLIERMEQFLAIAARHDITVMFVLFDDCFLPEPKVGKQPDPVPGVHNSQWTASPGEQRKKKENWAALEKYIKDVVGHFADDKRVLVWDLYNEPKPESRPLLEAAFAWARSVNPTQPLTTCWHADDLWDVVSFHDYGRPEPKQLARWVAERPALCTECIARGHGSRFDNVLPAFAEKGIGWYMWGLVKGRIQTYYPWGSKKDGPEPNPWHHDLLQPDGAPYRPDEIELIRKFPGQFHLPSAAGRTARQSEYRGWKTLALSNGLAELQVAPQIGGRVIQYCLGGFDFFWVNAQLAGGTSHRSNRWSFHPTKSCPCPRRAPRRSVFACMALTGDCWANWPGWG